MIFTEVVVAQPCSRAGRKRKQQLCAHTILGVCVFHAQLKPALFRAICLCAAQFVLTPWVIPYRIGDWANNRSAFMRIDTYRGAQSLGFGVYR